MLWDILTCLINKIHNGCYRKLENLSFQLLGIVYKADNNKEVQQDIEKTDKNQSDIKPKQMSFKKSHKTSMI
ncbi:hypothetical protein ACF0H5_002487 [Mactra antiquata]